MLEQLRLLEGLQKLDLQLREIEGAREALPARIRSMNADVGGVEALLERERRHLREVQAYRAGLDQAVQEDQQQISKTKAKLSQVRNSKEFNAAQREFEGNRRHVSERAQEIGKLTDAIEQTQQSIAQHEEDLRALQRHVLDEELAVQAKLTELDGQVEAQRTNREVTAARIDKALLRRYDQIRRLRDGVAVVSAVNGVCTGCRMHLPPQLYNLLQRHETVEQCPNCQRIVYFPLESDASAA